MFDPWPHSVGWGSSVTVSCGIGHRCSSDPTLLWLLCRLAAAAPIQPLAWEFPYAPPLKKATFPNVITLGVRISAHTGWGGAVYSRIHIYNFIWNICLHLDVPMALSSQIFQSQTHDLPFLCPIAFYLLLYLSQETGLSINSGPRNSRVNLDSPLSLSPHIHLTVSSVDSPLKLLLSLFTYFNSHCNYSSPVTMISCPE